MLSDVYEFLSGHAKVENDFKRASILMQKAFLPHYLQPERPSEPFSLCFSGRRLNDIDLFSVCYNQRMTVRTPPFESFICLHFTVSGQCDFKVDSETGTARPGDVYVSNPNQSFEQAMDPGYRQVSLKINRSALRSYLSNELRRPVSEPIEFAAKPLSIEGEASSLARHVALLAAELDSPVSVANALAPVRRLYEQTTLSLILGSMANNYSDAIKGNESNALPYYVRRAEHFIKTKFADDISLQDIVEASGVSRRAVHLGFQTHLGTTPMKLLKWQRLVAAREALQHAAGNGQTVTDIALQCGFSHLSKFAEDYQALFGKTPSATRRGS